MAQHADAHFSVNYAEPGNIKMNRASQIMSSESHASFLDAGEMLKHATKMAAEKMADATAGYQEACDHGYRDGTEKAHQEMMLANVAVILERSRALANLEQEVSNIVVQTIQQFLGETDRVDRVFMLVRQALARLGQLQGDVVLYVHPNMLDGVNTRLTLWNKANQSSHLKTIADPNMSTEGCRIVCGSGCIEGDLQQQVEALEAALRIDHITQPEEA
jgi:type III secretion system HrpE/YscL family protein